MSTTEESRIGSYYVYTIILGESARRFKDEYYLVTYKGKSTVTAYPTMIISSTEQLSLTDIANMFKDTKGIIKIEGSFKEDISKEEADLVNSINDK